MDNIVSSTELNLQTRSTETSIDASAVEANPSQTNSSQTYAKGLMDELFGDLDGLLDGTLVPPSEPLTVEEPKARTPINLDFATFLSTHPSIAASPGLVATLLASGLSASGVSASGMPELLSIPEDVVELPESKAGIARHEARASSYGLFEKMLIFVGCSSAVAAMMIMLGSQGVIGRVLAALRAGPATPVASVPANPNDVKFADYMGKTLESIDAKVKSTQPGANVPPLSLSIPGTSTLPTAKISGNSSGKASGSTSGPPIVIGGMPRSVAPGTAANVPTSVPMNTPGNAVVNPVQNDLNQAVSKLSGLVDRLSGGVNRSPAVAPIAVMPGTSAAARGPQAASVSQAPAPARTLKAVMELGSQSAILFEMNGVSQRYGKGENIGSSGWVVVKIENGSAIVRRNGEVRTLSVGQKI